MSGMKIAKEESIPSVCKSQAMFFCSVCLDAVVEGEDRSIARLKCGHHFHLDCIGSAFNAKGRMQCPNCRQVEQGHWLYANACCLHDDFFEDLAFEEDAEVYNAAVELQVSHAPWCPHQGSYGHGHISLAFEELDNFANGYLNPLRNAVHRVQVPGVSGEQIGPYLVGMHNIPLGRPLNHMEDIIALQINYVDRTSNHVGTGDASHGLQSGSLLSASNGAWTSSQSNTYNGLFVQPNFRHLSLGFLMGSPQSAQAGYTNLHPMGFLRRGQTHTRRTRHNDAFQRSTHISPSERGQMSEPIHGNGSSYSSGQSPNRAYHGDRTSWAAESSPMEGLYSYGVPAHWWAWVPRETSSAMWNMAPNTYLYHGGQFSSTSSRPTAAMAGSLEHTSGPYTWVLSGSH